MGGRLLKKLTGASAGSAAAADGESGDAGEGTSKAVATATGKKRKVPVTAQGDASPVKGEISMTASGYLQHLTCCVAARPAKKPKATQAQSSAVDKVAAPKVKIEDHGKSPPPPYGFHWSILTIIQQATVKPRKSVKRMLGKSHILEEGFT